MMRRNWLRWTVLTTSGWALGLAAGLLLGAPIQAIVGMMLVTPVVTALAGGVLGSSQWFAFARRPKAALWILASAVGLSLGLTLGITIVEQVGRGLTGGPVNVARLTSTERAGSFAAIGVVTGLCLGLAQWLVIRRSDALSIGWALISASAMVVALTTASLLTDATFGNIAIPISFVAFLVMSGCVYGFITGIRFRAVQANDYC